MKKLLTLSLVLLSLAVRGQTQNFTPQSFLNCLSLGVTNTGAYTNIAPFFGQSAYSTTNAQGLEYTNTLGTMYVDFLAATNTGPTLNTNATTGTNILFTNDLFQVTHDVLFHADANGNVCTNQILTFAMLGNGNMGGTTGSNFVAIFAPIVRGGTQQGAISGVIPPVLGNGGPGTVLDLNAQFTIFPTARTTTNWVWSYQLNQTNVAGYKGLRLMCLAITNSTGQVWFPDISLNGFNP